MTLVFEEVVPALREQGVMDDAVFHTIFTENPRALADLRDLLSPAHELIRLQTGWHGFRPAPGVAIGS